MRLVAVRLLLVALAWAAVALALARAGGEAPWQAAAMLSAAWLVPVNVATVWVLARHLRRSGASWRSLLGWRRDRLGTDVALGALLVVLLYVPFALAFGLALLVIGGPDPIAALERIVTPTAPPPAMAGTGLLLLASAAAVAFPLTNAPTEELLYRAHAQARLLAAGRPAWLAVLVPALAFGVQHAAFAPTAEAIPVFVAAFTAWGAAAGVALLRLRTLMPLVVAHLVTNLAFAWVPVWAVLAR